MAPALSAQVMVVGLVLHCLRVTWQRTEPQETRALERFLKAPATELPSAGRLSLLWSQLRGTVDSERLTLWNEALNELQYECESPRALLRAATRASLATGAGAAVLEFASGLGQGVTAWAPWALVSLLAGAVGAVLLVALGRLAESLLVRRRAAWNALSTVVFRPQTEGACTAPLVGVPVDRTQGRRRSAGFNQVMSDF